jgi:hypothetical protein
VHRDFYGDNHKLEFVFIILDVDTNVKCEPVFDYSVKDLTC